VNATRCTLNVPKQRTNLVSLQDLLTNNVQLRMAMRNMGTDTLFGRPGQEERGQARYSGARAFCRDLSMHLPAQIRGQTRCSIYRSGTFNVQRSTLNFQWGDRKGGWWPGYGDRHGVLPVGGANRGTGTIFGPGDRTFDTSEQTQRPVERSNRAAAPTYGDRHDVRYTGQERST